MQNETFKFHNGTRINSSPSEDRWLSCFIFIHTHTVPPTCSTIPQLCNYTNPTTTSHFFLSSSSNLLHPINHSSYPLTPPHFHLPPSAPPKHHSHHSQHLPKHTTTPHARGGCAEYMLPGSAVRRCEQQGAQTLGLLALILAKMETRL